MTMRTTIFRIGALGGFSILLIAAACSGPGKPSAPTEAEIHADEKQRLAWHPYRCDDGGTVFVEFADDGLRINVGPVPGKKKAVSLTAPAAGLQYVGEQSTATLKGSRLILAGSEVGGSRSCERANTF
jgi:hypothetical protein